MKGFKQKDLHKTKKFQNQNNLQNKHSPQKSSSEELKTLKTSKILKICKQKNSFHIFEKLQKFLINQKSPKSLINQKDKFGKTPLMYCIEKNDLESVRLLLDYGADVNIRDNLDQNSVFYILKNKNFDFDIFEELLRKNVFLGFLNKFLESVFLKGLKMGNMEVVRILWNFDVDFFGKDVFGFNSVDLVFINRNHFLIQNLKLKFSEQRFNSFLSYYTEDKINFLKNNFEKIKSEYKIIEAKKNSATKKKKIRLNPNSSNFSPKFKKPEKIQIQNKFENLQKHKKIQIKQKKNTSELKKNSLNTELTKNSLKIISEKNKNLVKQKISKKKIISQKKEEIKKQKSEIENYISKIKLLSKKNNDLKKKLLSKTPKNSHKSQFFKKSKKICFSKNSQKKIDQKKNEKNNYQKLYENITKKINTYIKWLENHKKLENPLFKQIEKIIKKTIKNNFDQILIETGGSFSIDLLMPWSDLNIVVSFDQKFYDYNQENIFHNKIKNFVKKLKMMKMVKNLKYEERSNLDIVKIEMSKEFRNKKVEIIFKHFINNNYPKNENIIKNFIFKYPISKPLYIIFRKILHAQKLDDPSKFGLRTICIFFLIIGFLQNLKYKISKTGKIEEIEKNRIGELFLNFVYFFGYTFNFDREMINPILEENNLFEKKSIMLKNFHKKVRSLTILNPYKNSIILTKSFRRTAELKSLFKFMYISFFQFCRCSEKNKDFEEFEKKEEKSFLDFEKELEESVIFEEKNKEISLNCKNNITFSKNLEDQKDFDFFGNKKSNSFCKNLKDKKNEDFLSQNLTEINFLEKNENNFYYKNNEDNFLNKKNEINVLGKKNTENFSNEILEKKNNSFSNKKNDIEEKDTTTPENVLFKFQQIIIKYKNMISEKKKIKFIKFSHEVEFFSENKSNLFSEENLLSEKSNFKSYDSEFSLNRLFNFNLCEPLIYN